MYSFKRTQLRDEQYTVFLMPPSSNLLYDHAVKFIIGDSILKINKFYEKLRLNLSSSRNILSKKQKTGAPSYLSQ